MNQTDVFKQEEADNYFQRNKSGYTREMNEILNSDLIIRVLDLYHLFPHSVIEIGAANGFRVEALRIRAQEKGWKNGEFVAVEPSKDAIDDGQKQYPNITFVQSTTDELELSQKFELVIINFVFHWVGRENLFKSIERLNSLCIDSSSETSGYLIIGDFSPCINKYKVKYHHTDKDMFTYKQNYADIFVSTGMYLPISFLSYDYGTFDFSSTANDESNRRGIWLLKKLSEVHYINAEIGKK